MLIQSQKSSPKLTTDNSFIIANCETDLLKDVEINDEVTKHVFKHCNSFEFEAELFIAKQIPRGRNKNTFSKSEVISLLNLCNDLVKQTYEKKLKSFRSFLVTTCSQIDN